MRLPLLLGEVMLVAVGPVQAHYHILHPNRNSVKVGDAVIFSYGFGHPYERELFDAEKPEKATLLNRRQGNRRAGTVRAVSSRNSGRQEDCGLSIHLQARNTRRLYARGWVTADLDEGREALFVRHVASHSACGGAKELGRAAAGANEFAIARSLAPMGYVQARCFFRRAFIPMKAMACRTWWRSNALARCRQRRCRLTSISLMPSRPTPAGRPHAPCPIRVGGA